MDFYWENLSHKQILLSGYDHFSTKKAELLKQEINFIFNQFAGRRGFIDDTIISDLCIDLIVFLDDKVSLLIDSKHLEPAFELTNYIFLKVGNMDDSNDGIALVANSCYNYWRKILAEVTDKAQKIKMFQWFQTHMKDTVLDYMEAYIYEFFMNEFNDRDFLLRKMDLLDQMIMANLKSKEEGRFWSGYYGNQDNILQRIEIMKRLGISESVIREYKNKFRQFSVIRWLAIDEYIKNREYTKAITVLKESKERDKAYPGLLSEYSRNLIDIFEKQNMSYEYKEELLYHLTNHSQSNLELYNRLKKICGQQEWTETIEKILPEVRWDL